jgi:hypothetical protein
MALFTDGAPSNIDELTAHDSQLLTVANVEGIDVTQKLTLAWSELEMELHTMLNAFGTADRMVWQSTAGLGSVVVTAPLKLWHTYRALQLVYEDAYNSQMNDRYAGKRDRYGERAMWARERLMEIGIGIAAIPVPRAEKPTVISYSGDPGSNLADGTYYVTVTWLNRNGEEGAAAEQTEIAVAGSTFEVIASTQPPNAVGWNVYAGTDPNAMRLQNNGTLEIGERWTQGAAISTARRMPGVGQPASFLKPAPRILQRG